jgi:hypothetical protein
MNCYQRYRVANANGGADPRGGGLSRRLGQLFKADFKACVTGYRSASSAHMQNIEIQTNSIIYVTMRIV